jgi:hypothetical protein
MKPQKSSFEKAKTFAETRFNLMPRRTLWCVERKGQCANAEAFAKDVPNAIAVFRFKPTPKHFA